MGMKEEMTMAEYASLRKIEFELCGGNLPEKYKAFVRRVLNDRNLIPAADVAPVVHGRWMKRIKGGTLCSRCGSYTQHKGNVLDMSKAIACPWCGAIMDGGTE